MKRTLLAVSVLLATVSMVQSQSIFIVTDDPQLEQPGEGNLGDFLRDLGYAVAVDPGIEAPGERMDDDSAFHGVLSADQVATLESHDLVLFHRSTNSGDFGDGIEQWNGLTVPMLNGSSFTPRDSRWQWIPGGQATDNTEFLWVVDDQMDHPIMTDVTIDGNLARMFDEGVPMDINALDTAGDVGNGVLVAETDLTFLSAIVDWSEPGLFFDGGTASHENRIVFFSLLRYFEDDGAGVILFENYSEDGLKMIANAVEYSIHGDVDPNRTPTGGGTGVASWSLY